MRITLLLIVLAAVIIACNKPAKGPNGVAYKSAVQYNDYIVSRQSSLIKNVLKFGKVAESSLDSAGLLLDGFISDTEKMISELKGMPAWKGDTSLRNAAVKSFTFYKSVFEKDYRRIIEIRKDENRDVKAQSEINDIIKKISKEEEKFDKDFHNAQRDFATKNKMKLVQNELQKTIDEEK
jgi:hypothetical protein